MPVSVRVAVGVVAELAVLEMMAVLQIVVAVSSVVVAVVALQQEIAVG